MAVRIRMKKLGRKHRPFFRVCAMESRAPRDGKVIEELGYYDPMVPETDARAILHGERIDYWLSVGAKPTPKVGVLIKKYGTGGSHLEQQQAALDRLAQSRKARPVPTAVPQPAEEPEGEAPAEPTADEEPAAEATESSEAEAAEDSGSESPAEEEKE